MSVAQLLGRVLQSAFEPKKVGLLIGGLDVAHTHMHLVPIETVHDLDYDRQQTDAADADPRRRGRGQRFKSSSAHSASVAMLGSQRGGAGRHARPDMTTPCLAVVVRRSCRGSRPAHASVSTVVHAPRAPHACRAPRAGSLLPARRPLATRPVGSATRLVRPHHSFGRVASADDSRHPLASCGPCSTVTRGGE
jgi:hypothetical protein